MKLSKPVLWTLWNSVRRFVYGCAMINILSRSQLNSDDMFLCSHVTAENNVYHSIIVKCTSRKSSTMLLCCDLDNTVAHLVAFCNYISYKCSRNYCSVPLSFISILFLLLFLLLLILLLFKSLSIRNDRQSIWDEIGQLLFCWWKTNHAQ